VTRQDSIDAGFAEAVAKMGKLDILINNAALFSAAPIVEITRADYDRLFAVNVAGTLFCMQAAARHMIARGRAARSSTWPARPGGGRRRWSPSIARPRPPSSA
jgi:NAD(P)-dependent dehydrogenase (short-subunit alcohol dehydrogenase family)